MFSIQAKCYLGDVAEIRVRTTMPQQPLCVVRAAGWQKVRLKFLSVTETLLSRTILIRPSSTAAVTGPHVGAERAPRLSLVTVGTGTLS
jgi:hypothetical protein